MFLTFLFASTFLLTTYGNTGADDSDETISCAAASLYFLLEDSTSNTADLDAIAKMLPVRDGGSSIEEILQSAKKAGFRLSVRDVSQSRQLPDSAFIAYRHSDLRRGNQDIGHFQFVRPVDVRGRQFQVLDPPRYPEIVEEADLFNDERFRGIVLIRRDFPSSRETAAIITAVIGTLGLAVSAVRAVRRRGAQSGQLQARTER